MSDGAPSQESTTYAGKFNSVEDLEAGYKALEAKLGQPAEPSQPQGDPNPSTPAVDFNAMTNELIAQGELSDSSKKALADAGIPDSVVKSHVESVKASIASGEQILHDAAGGKEQYETVQAWAKSSLSEQERDDLESMAKISPAMAQQAVKTMMEKYEAANGKLPEVQLGGAPGTTNGASFNSVQEMKDAMKDPKYKTDPAYRKQVHDRLAVSNI